MLVGARACHNKRWAISVRARQDDEQPSFRRGQVHKKDRSGLREF